MYVFMSLQKKKVIVLCDSFTSCLIRHASCMHDALLHMLARFSGFSSRSVWSDVPWIVSGKALY
jgi:hypothetical protein